jgi:hypothetical protein
MWQKFTRTDTDISNELKISFEHNWLYALPAQKSLYMFSL